MTYDAEISTLESEWEPETGFFWRIREGIFIESEFMRAMQKLSSVSISEDAKLPRRLVSLLWYIPLFMQWQLERVQEAGGDMQSYARAIKAMTNEIERLLGVP